MNINSNQKGIEIDNPLENAEQSASVRQDNDNQDGSTKLNKTILWIVVSILLVILLGRTFYLQVVRGSYFRDVAENNRIRVVLIKAPRGIIKDTHGEVLARNVPSFDVVFVPAYLPKDSFDRDTVVSKLAVLFGKNEDEIKAMLSRPKEDDRRAYLLEENIEAELALQIVEREKELEGIYISNSARREYVDGEKFAHIVGYDGKITQEELQENPDYYMIDYVGKDGLEQFYERSLHGQHGQHRFEVDSNNNIKQDLGVVNPIAGDELVLNVDAQLQKKAQEVLGKVLEENKDATGAVLVAIDPRDGGVRALVSLPGFDNNLFSGGIRNEDYQNIIGDERNPLLNRAIGGKYPPGSTFKPVMAAAALQEGTITEHTSVNCSGGISVGEWQFPDWKVHGHTDVKKAIAESCDVFFYSVGGGHGGIAGLGMNRMQQYGKMFGYGEKTGIDLPGEIDGVLPDENWKFKKFGEKWYLGDDYHAAIGQGYVAVTPLQMALATSAIANGGKVYEPKIVDRIIKTETGKTVEIQPKMCRENIVTAENIQIVREGMKLTVTGDQGSGRSLGSLKVASAGKTGTSQFGSEDKTHAWYSSFAPYEQPELAMIVLVESGGEGHDWAVPVTKEIYQWYFDYERGSQMPGKEETGKTEEIVGNEQ